MARKRTLDRRSTSDRIREILIERILDGSYPPGHRIIEMELAGEFETSQAPVREALRELQGLRLVTVRPYRGACVREVTEREMVEALEIRSVLEAFSAGRAGPVLRAVPDDLRAALDAMEGAAEANDPDAFARADLAFHRVIVGAADRGALLPTWESLGVGLRIRMLLRRTGVDLKPVARAHVPIAEAIERADDDTAARLLRHHAEEIYRIAGLDWHA